MFIKKGFYMLAENTKEKFKKINNNKEAKEMFSISEIIQTLIDISLAEKLFGKKDFSLILKMFDILISFKEEFFMNYDSFIKTCDFLVNQFDMIIPYWKISKAKKIFWGIILDCGKKPYRERARKLLLCDKFLDEEWMNLYKEFHVKFCL